MMVWHGSSRTQGGKVTLSDGQRIMLTRLAEDSEYWSKAHDFVKQVDGRELCSLSVNQLEWYYSIDAGLEVEVNRREARIAFGLEREDGQ